MTDLQARAKAYAVSILNNNDCETFTRQEMYYALSEAYEQGYIDCNAEGERLRAKRLRGVLPERNTQ